jgi:hypothetical protein
MKIPNQYLTPMQIIKSLSTHLCGFTILVFAVSFWPVHAQTSAPTSSEGSRKSSGDVSQEITLTGNVSRVLPTGAPGMITGSHLLVETSAGMVDASLGRFGLLGGGARSVSAGQQIEATGVMRTVQGKSVFLVRTVKINGETYTIRNRHGFPVSPQARERARQKGGSL